MGDTRMIEEIMEEGQLIEQMQIIEVPVEDEHIPVTFESMEEDGYSSPVRIPEPYVGQEWEDEAQARQYYIEYAKMVGFGIRTRTSRPGVDFRLVCNRAGVVPNTNHLDNETEYDKTTSTLCFNCPVCISVGQSKKTNGRWVVRSLQNTHNHPCLSPVSKPFLHSNTEMTETAQFVTERFHKVGVPICKVARVLQEEGNFDKKDCYNYMNKLRSQLIDDGDARAVLTYCQNMKKEDPEFFYSMTVDESGRMENFFWVDSYSRNCYQIFGDAITFDTTYRTNKYKMPFAPFVGVNHHMQSTVFGCALMLDETKESFVWLFNTFLEAMNGKLPNAIITDQDQRMCDALFEAMPKVRHRLCYWHIKKKFPERFAPLYQKGSVFRNELKQCLGYSRTTKEFDLEWNMIVSSNALENDTWLAGLYHMCEKWVHVYCRNTFFAGMTTTQRSESMNSFFDKFVHSGTTLHEFVGQFEEALSSRIKESQKEDYFTRHKECTLKLGSPRERHASKVYTRKVFSIFRKELRQIYEYRKEEVKQEGPKVTYRVIRHIENASDTRNKYREVLFDHDLQSASCSYQEFEFRGILCRHALMVLVHEGLDKIPTENILSRWTKNANRLLDCTPVPSNVGDAAMLRLHHFNRASRMLQDG